MTFEIFENILSTVYHSCYYFVLKSETIVLQKSTLATHTISQKMAHVYIILWNVNILYFASRPKSVKTE